MHLSCRKPTDPKPYRILISRIDHIGDVVLTLPLAPLIKQHFPHAEVFFMTRSYTRALIECYPLIDGFIDWDALAQQTETEAVVYLKHLRFDTVIHVSPHRLLAKLAAKAGIKTRIGTSHRWFHYRYCNQRVAFSRSRSALHEAQLNVKLLAPLNIHTELTLSELMPLMMLCPTPSALPPAIEHLLDPQRFNLILHPLSNGNAREWPLDYYRQLIHSLPDTHFNIFITGTDAEKHTLQSLAAQCPQAHFICGALNLDELIQFIARCDGLIAASTGPLHIAASLGIKTLGLFPPTQTMNPTRWKPLGNQAEYLITPSPSACHTRCLNPDNRSCACLQAIDVQQVLTVLERWIQ